MTRVGAVGLGAPLVAAAGARLGRLCQMRPRPRRRQRLADEQPARARLDGDVDLVLRATRHPLLHSVTAGEKTAAADLAAHRVQCIEGDLCSMNVEPRYDRHLGPPLRSGPEPTTRR